MASDGSGTFLKFQIYWLFLEAEETYTHVAFRQWRWKCVEALLLT